MQRHDLYLTIHKALRRELAILVSEAGAIDTPTAWSALAARFARLAALLDDHAAHEDRFVHPELARVAPVLAAELAAAHVDLERDLGAARAALAEAALGGRARARNTRAYRALVAFAGAYAAHMEVEETRAMPALWAAYDDGHLLAVHARLLAAISPDAMARFLAILLPALDLDERVELLGGVRASAPPPAFAHAMDLAAQVLAAPALAETTRALEVVS